MDTALHLLDLEPYAWSSHYILCQALLSGRRPRTRQAYEAAQEARDLAPWNPDTHNLVGMCAADLKRPDEAEAAYREALRLDPQHAYAMNNLAALALDRGEFGSAGAGLTAAAQTTPQEEVIRANLDLLVVKWSAAAALRRAGSGRAGGRAARRAAPPGGCEPSPGWCSSPRPSPASGGSPPSCRGASRWGRSCSAACRGRRAGSCC